MKLHLKDIILLLIFFCLLLTSLWTYNIYLLFTFSVLSLLFLPMSKWWDGMAISLLFFSLFYGIMVILNGKVTSNFNLFSYMIAPVAFYRFGRWSMTVFREDISRQKFLMQCILLYLVYYFILTFRDIAIVGLVNETRILLGDIGDVQSSAATLYGMMASIGLGCIGSVFCKKENLWMRVSFIIITLLSFLCVIHLVNRTGVITLLVCLLVLFLIPTKSNRSKMLGGLFLLSLMIIIMKTGLIEQGVLEAYAQREENSNDISSIGGRYQMWVSAVHDMFVHPFGWNPVGYTYAHNMWLDVARVGGLLPLLPFLLTTLLHIKNLFHIVKRKSNSNFAIILISINTAMILSSFVEPVIEGSLLFFCMLMMIWGITKSIATEKL